MEVWKLARDLTVSIHDMSLTLPNFEQFEVGAQIRRSIKSVKSNIVEGYARRYHKNEFVRFILTAFASACETTDHLETLFETKSLRDQEVYDDLKVRLERLCKMLNNFLKTIRATHKRPNQWAEND